MSATIALLEEIKAGAETLGIAPTTLCQRAVQNGKLVQRLESGGKVTLDTVEKLRSYIQQKKLEQTAQ